MIDNQGTFILLCRCLIQQHLIGALTTIHMSLIEVGYKPPLLILQSSYQNGPDLEVGHFSNFFNRGWLPPLLDFAVTPITKATFMYMGGSLFTECMAISAKLTKGKLFML